MSTNTRYFTDREGFRWKLEAEQLFMISAITNDWEEMLSELDYYTKDYGLVETDSTGAPLVSASINTSQVDSKDAQIHSLTATVAAMREALENAAVVIRDLRVTTYMTLGSTADEFSDAMGRIAKSSNGNSGGYADDAGLSLRAALAPDAGKGWIRREPIDKLSQLCGFPIVVDTEQVCEVIGKKVTRLERESAALREQVKANPYFVQRMGLEIAANSHKGDWGAWKPTDPSLLLGEILHHFNKLDAALLGGNREQVSEFAADIANFAMKTHEMFGATPAQPGRVEGSGE